MAARKDAVTDHGDTTGEEEGRGGLLKAERGALRVWIQRAYATKTRKVWLGSKMEKILYDASLCTMK